MTYNTTPIENAKSVGELFIATNNLTSSLFAGFLILMINLIMLFILKDRYEFGAILLSTNFATGVIAGLLWFIGAIPFSIVVIPITFTVISIFITMFGNN